MVSPNFPLWLRFVLLIGVFGLAVGVGLFGYRSYTHPVTLSVAVGSIDGEAAKAMSAIANRLVTTNAFSGGKVDLAVVRGDVGDLSQAQAVVVVSHVVLLIVAPPGSAIDSVDKLKGHRVGVIGGQTNARIVDVLV